MSFTPQEVPSDDAICLQHTIVIYLGDDEENGIVGKIIGENETAIVAAVDMPEREYVNSPFRNTPIKCSVAGLNCVYHFDSQYLSCGQLPSMMWLIAKPPTVMRSQNRRYVRVPAPHLPLKVKLSNEYGTFKNAKDRMLIDISGGGLSFASDEPTKAGSKVDVEISNLPHIGTFHAIGEVRRCQTLKTRTDRTVYHIGISLEGTLSRTEHDKLMRAVHEIQRTYLERGMGVK